MFTVLAASKITKLALDINLVVAYTFSVEAVKTVLHVQEFDFDLSFLLFLIHIAPQTPSLAVESQYVSKLSNSGAISGSFPPG